MIIIDELNFLNRYLKKELAACCSPCHENQIFNKIIRFWKNRENNYITVAKYETITWY